MTPDRKPVSGCNLLIAAGQIAHRFIHVNATQRATRNWNRKRDIAQMTNWKEVDRKVKKPGVAASLLGHGDYVSVRLSHKRVQGLKSATVLTLVVGFETMKRLCWRNGDKVSLVSGGGQIGIRLSGDGCKLRNVKRQQSNTQAVIQIDCNVADALGLELDKTVVTERPRVEDAGKLGWVLVILG